MRKSVQNLHIEYYDLKYFVIWSSGVKPLFILYFFLAEIPEVSGEVPQACDCAGHLLVALHDSGWADRHT